MDEIIRVSVEDTQSNHKNAYEGYEYYKRELVPKGMAQQCRISIYKIPPGKAAYPYHYHTKNEEAFYIISGKGILKTINGAKEVNEGDFLFFPANEKGAHKLTNVSEKDMLVYIDFDTFNDIDVAFYPDSGKIGIWGKDINQLYSINQKVEYYDGE